MTHNENKACPEPETGLNHIHVNELVKQIPIEADGQDPSYDYYETTIRCFICKEYTTITYQAHKGI